MVLEQGIIEGRKTYANMIKYIKMTASSNFGNMFSVLAASALLPFLPMESVHLIFLNLIYDLSCTAIPWDNVDEEFIAKPRKWDASSVGSFMIWIGPTSSIFDFTTYIFMYFVFCPFFVSKGILFNDLPTHFSGTELTAMQTQYIGMFQAGWFVECSILCVSASVYLIVYDFGNKLEKSLCPSLWRIALRRCNNELERTLDDTFWNYGMAWSEHRILGGFSCCITDCNSYERPILVYEAENRHQKLS